MFVGEGDDALCHLHGIKATIFPEKLEFASLAHADDGLVITKRATSQAMIMGRPVEALCLGAPRPGDEIGRN